MTAPIATLPKNTREEIQFSLVEFKGVDLCDLRVFVPGDGDPIATKKGLSFRPALLPDIIAGLQKVEAEARRRGLIVREAA